jgi:hypothetical protein
MEDAKRRSAVVGAHNPKAGLFQISLDKARNLTIVVDNEDRPGHNVHPSSIDAASWLRRAAA